MAGVETTRMSSKGQVVIPEELRKRLGLTAGQQFVVVGEDDVVILKSIDVPSMRDFDKLIRKAREAAAEVGLRRTDIARAIARARSR